MRRINKHVIQLVVSHMQALVTLQWLLGSGHLQSEPSWKLNQQEIQTAKALWTLIHGYLYRYFPTLSLNFHQLLEHILMCATPSMQQPALQSFQPCVEVISKALRRCAVDKAVYAAEPQPENERDYASQMFIIFWVFLSELHMSCCAMPCCAALRYALPLLCPLCCDLQ